MKNDAFLKNSIADQATGALSQPGPILPEQLRAQHLALALDSLGQALVVLCCRGEILHVSPQASSILAENDGLLVADTKLHASLEMDDTKLQTALSTLARANGKPELQVHRPSGKTPYKIRVNPFRLPEESSSKESRGALVLIHDAHANHAAWQNRLRDKFRLTPRECECAAMLSEGLSLPEISERMGISTQTLRQHVKHAMQKTGTHKQHELAGLVMQMHRKR